MTAKVIMTHVAGYLCIILIHLFRLIPLYISRYICLSLLPLYRLLRYPHTSRIKNLWQRLPFSKQLKIGTYYRQRLNIYLNLLYSHGKGPSDTTLTIVDGPYFQEAFKTGRPILLCGIHSGPFEWLYKSPQAPEIKTGHRPFFTLTASSFSPPLTRYMQTGRLLDGKRAILNNRIQGVLPVIIRQKGILAVMVDQMPGEDKDFITLWDQIKVPVHLKLVSWMAQQGALILPITSYLDDNGKPVAAFHPHLNSGTINNKAGLENTLRQFLEQAIEEHPLQWNWSYPGLRSVGTGLKW